MITVQKDKEVIRSLLVSDNFITRNGFSPENITTTRYGTDIVNAGNASNQIHISSGQPEKSNSDVVKNLVYVVTVSGERADSDQLDEVVEQVIAILDRRDIGRGHILYLLDPPMELASDPALYIQEVTFLCQSTNFNVIKK